MAKKNLGFAPNYAHLHFIKDPETNESFYLGPGISNIEPDNEDETSEDAYYDGGGAQRKDVTGATLADKFTGHRFYGDPAQDYIASKKFEIGSGREVIHTHISPDGSRVEGPATLTDIVDHGGDANGKGTFECVVTYSEKPSLTEPNASDLPTAIEFEQVDNVKVGDVVDLASKIKVTPETAAANCVFALDTETMEKEAATVDAAGRLVAKQEGSIKVTAKCVAKPAATATTTITVSGEA